MSHMEHRSSLFTTFFLFLMLITLPYFSRGGSRSESLDSEMYEIDYRGPETHSSVPPPDHHSHGKPHSSHPQSSAGAAAKVMEEKVKKVHG